MGYDELNYGMKYHDENDVGYGVKDCDVMDYGEHENDVHGWDYDGDGELDCDYECVWVKLKIIIYVDELLGYPMALRF
jgi:hypothetical protein